MSQPLSGRCGQRRPPLAAAAQMSGRLRIAPYLFRLILLVTLTTAVLSCEREIAEDICPQREGFDKDCELRCQREYPHRLSSACHLRSTGTLLSFFGIKSFICKCHLPEQFCVAGHAQNVHRRSFSLQDLTTHSTVTALTRNSECTKPSSTSLTCHDDFGATACAWQRSQGDWYVAEPRTAMPFAPGEAPTHRYLVGVAKGGTGVLQLDTCPALCSVDSVNVTMKIWRGPWVGAELCFREQDATMCAPLRISNGKWVNEVIPQTSHFQISIKFKNVTDGDVILLDDVSTQFTECPVPAKITSHNHQSMRKAIPITKALGTSLPSSINKALLVDEKYGSLKEVHSNSITLKKRFCKEGECTTIVHHGFDGAVLTDRMCIGRLGLSQCRDKCLSDGAEGKSARCIRQREFPFQKRCLCQVRRSPMHRVDGGSRKSGDTTSSLRTNATEIAFKRAIPQDVAKNVHLIAKNAKLADSDVCSREDSDEVCDRECKRNDTNSSGRCQADGDHVVCRCSLCLTSLCDFEKDEECGWTDMHVVDEHFGNVSIASKRDQKNRYGLSRIRSSTHSGLYRRGPFDGPITLSVDVYPTEGIDVRICIDTLQKCQTQKVTAKSWNRVRAKIKVKHAERIFLLFFNASDEDRTMAMDNISLKSGRCAIFN